MRFRAKNIILYFLLFLQVYARQKGFTFWPAKVIRVSNPERPDGGSYDVRFFGGYHQRAVVDKSSIRPITVSVSSLGIKRQLQYYLLLDFWPILC